jgi:hypothetical protein
MLGRRAMVGSVAAALAAVGAGAALAATHGSSRPAPRSHRSNGAATRVGGATQQAPRRIRGVRCHHDEQMMSATPADL